ncbi:hypothetical protein TRV_06099 [Trichophyton verrucosum HKI 0517]|uniref:Uncharacterized protein n=1 Tax=Trichophyton verrucosum (strain HKI 0517) TaxID=663202 RepID=D4DFZ7_TRIVH|nr:uncharacterized protein TRV_06099 [Trichophyton verrucosum HKI 0517]EFE39187.1 hypothetical protein TRV_06099 [Trichophyton verrucosum HKI 0517]
MAAIAYGCYWHSIKTGWQSIPFNTLSCIRLDLSLYLLSFFHLQAASLLLSWSHLLLIFIFPRHVTRMSLLSILGKEKKKMMMARALSCPLLVFSSASLSSSSPVMPFVNFTP